MARISTYKPSPPIEIDTFLGLNESVGNTQIKLGESVRQENARVTKNFKLQKRPGHHTYISSTNNIYGGWYGELNDKEVIIFSTGGFLYQRDLSVVSSETELSSLLQGAWDDSDVWDDSGIWDEAANPPVITIGAITDGYCEIFYFDSKLWLKAGTSFKTWDGVTYEDVTPYIPIVSTGAKPDGTGGVPFEEINLLTGSKTVDFEADGTTEYTLPEQNIDADLVTATVDGVAKVENIDFTVNRVTGKPTFNVAPPLGVEVLITYTKDTGTLAEFQAYKYQVDFGVGNDTNIFWYGSTLEPNTFIFSMVGKANYYPSNSKVIVGSNEFGITDMKAQQQTLLVFKENSTRIVVPNINPSFANNQGLNPYEFPYYDLNESVGNIAPKMVQLIEDTPVSLDAYSMWLWSDTSVENQRGTKIISDKIKKSLQELDLSTAVTFNHKNNKEYWLCVGDVVYLWNYGNDTFYKYTNVSASKFFDVDGQVYYIGSTTIENFNDSYTADGEVLGTDIDMRVYLGFTDFGQLEFRKMMRDEWVAISPASKTSLDIKFLTDKSNEDSASAKSSTVKYRLFDYGSWDYSDFTYQTNRNPQPLRIKAKVKKFTYLQVLFENVANDETLTVLNLKMQAQAQGYSR